MLPTKLDDIILGISGVQQAIGISGVQQAIGVSGVQLAIEELDLIGVSGVQYTLEKMHETLLGISGMMTKSEPITEPIILEGYKPIGGVDSNNRQICFLSDNNKYSTDDYLQDNNSGWEIELQNPFGSMIEFYVIAIYYDETTNELEKKMIHFPRQLTNNLVLDTRIKDIEKCVVKSYDNLYLYGGLKFKNNFDINIESSTIDRTLFSGKTNCFLDRQNIIDNIKINSTIIDETIIEVSLEYAIPREVYSRFIIWKGYISKYSPNLNLTNLNITLPDIISESIKKNLPPIAVLKSFCRRISGTGSPEITINVSGTSTKIST